ncbi:MAG TPA: hypothetical protein VKF80_01375 [Candidatus Eisenbacteria bacterium]|nr:hypothetical protein [Candidatus Eisenbacteria bacterium]
MTRPYVFLFAAILVCGVTLALVRGPHSAAPDRATLASPTAAAETLALVVSDGAVTPAAASAPKGARVLLGVTCGGKAAIQLALAGYEDRLRVPRLEPGESWQGSFVADRPGDDFAWLVNGKPVASFRVTGSHLVEGHR